MTLRLRLVIALVVLVAAGLAVFSVVTTTLYRNSEYQRLDTQIQSSYSLIDGQLDQQAGLTQFGGPGLGGGAPGEGGGPHGGPPVQIPPDTFAELVSPGGTVLAHFSEVSATAQPKLPAKLPAATLAGRFFDVGSSSGSGGYRIVVRSGQDGNTTVIAVPTSEVTSAVQRLVLIEAFGALALLLVLSGGSWLVLRRGLRPLERMAVSARSITAGDLSERVSPAGGPSEVGQLGLALNTMLSDIEIAFREREATEQRLRQFLADASHELRTPLTSIQGFAELFRVSGDNARVDLPTILRRIEDESARMKVLVEDLLMLARLDQQRATERVPVDLAVLAADACSDAVAHAPDRPIILDAPEPVVISADEDHMRQAIANLVTNAVRHTAEGTRIEVSAQLENGSAMVRVRDHGSGLDATALEHAFDRFWQADKARVGTSAGLGLAIVASIAAEHGGTVTAANADDGGAVFTLRMPLNQRIPGESEPSPRIR